MAMAQSVIFRQKFSDSPFQKDRPRSYSGPSDLYDQLTGELLPIGTEKTVIKNVRSSSPSSSPQMSNRRKNKGPSSPSSQLHVSKKKGRRLSLTDFPPSPVPDRLQEGLWESSSSLRSDPSTGQPLEEVEEEEEEKDTGTKETLLVENEGLGASSPCDDENNTDRNDNTLDASLNKTDKDSGTLDATVALPEQESKTSTTSFIVRPDPIKCQDKGMFTLGHTVGYPLLPQGTMEGELVIGTVANHLTLLHNDSTELTMEKSLVKHLLPFMDTLTC